MIKKRDDVDKQQTAKIRVVDREVKLVCVIVPTVPISTVSQSTRYGLIIL